MIDNDARGRVRAIPIAAGMNFRRRSPSEIARIVLQVIFVAVTAALFLAWLTSPNVRRPAVWGFAPQSGCPSVGRGGAPCFNHSGNDDRSN